mgnify:CR=1 FL=1
MMTELERLEREYRLTQTVKDMLHFLQSYYAERKGKDEALMDALWHLEMDYTRDLEKLKKEILKRSPSGPL